jgi:hypothetical protein
MILEDILFIAIASFFCGTASWYDMEEFGKAKAECLKTFLRKEIRVISEQFLVNNESMSFT